MTKKSKNNSISIKKVSPFHPRKPGVISFLHYAAPAAPMLHDLKEAPDSSGDGCHFTGRTSAKMPGRKASRQRLRVIHATSFHCASSLAMFSSDRKSHDFPAHLYLLIVSAFYLRLISGQCCSAPETFR
ncbi:hypothetical protein LFZ50_09695 [Salmonella enterica subsp. arizonae serovar 53:-:- str. SA20100345]|nr:hypothetical protein LFZ50_09695 [Salmonella enterica subsp. arizonae serovar 53:-:- str. SA20100345]